MGKLAITGGEPLRKTPFPSWPMSTKEEAAALEDVLTSSRWGGQPFPGNRYGATVRDFATTLKIPVIPPLGPVAFCT